MIDTVKIADLYGKNLEFLLYGDPRCDILVKNNAVVKLRQRIDSLALALEIQIDNKQEKAHRKAVYHNVLMYQAHCDAEGYNDSRLDDCALHSLSTHRAMPEKTDKKEHQLNNEHKISKGVERAANVFTRIVKVEQPPREDI
jgi:hypothetical protein